MVPVELGERLSNAGGGFTGTIGLENENSRPF